MTTTPPVSPSSTPYATFMDNTRSTLTLTTDIKSYMIFCEFTNSVTQKISNHTFTHRNSAFGSNLHEEREPSTLRQLMQEQAVNGRFSSLKADCNKVFTPPAPR